MTPSLIQRLRDKVLPPICNEAADELIELQRKLRSYQLRLGAILKELDDDNK